MQLLADKVVEQVHFAAVHGVVSAAGKRSRFFLAEFIILSFAQLYLLSVYAVTLQLPIRNSVADFALEDFQFICEFKKGAILF